MNRHIKETRKYFLKEKQLAAISQNTSVWVYTLPICLFLNTSALHAHCTFNIVAFEERNANV